MKASRVVVVYLLLAIVSALVMFLLGRQIGFYRFLPARCQEARKTAIRMRLLLSCSIYVLGYAFIGVALAMKNGHAGYFDHGFVQTIHILLHPIIMFAVSMLAEYWVATLPPQLIPPGSLAAKLSTAAEKHKLFIAIGSFNAGTVAVFGVVTFFNPLLGVALADLAIASGAFIAIVAVMFVASQITGFINQATAKASASSRAFYSAAKASLWQQAVGLCSVGFVAISIIAVRNLAPAGRSTPVIMFTIQALSGHAFGVVSTLATRFQAVSATGSTAAVTGASKATSARRSAFILSPRNVAAFTAKLVLPKTNGGGLNIYSKTDTPGDDGIEAHRGEVFEIEDGTRRGAGIVPEG